MAIVEQTGLEPGGFPSPLLALLAFLLLLGSNGRLSLGSLPFWSRSFPFHDFTLFSFQVVLAPDDAVGADLARSERWIECFQTAWR